MRIAGLWTAPLVAGHRTRHEQCRHVGPWLCPAQLKSGRLWLHESTRDHKPWPWNDDNCKCSDVAVLSLAEVAATRKNAPSGEMFRMGIRWAGLELLARFRIREGMGFCVDMMNEYGRVRRCANARPVG
jgi:hypothetical protein